MGHLEHCQLGRPASKSMGTARSYKFLPVPRGVLLLQLGEHQFVRIWGGKRKESIRYLSQVSSVVSGNPKQALTNEFQLAPRDVCVIRAHPGTPWLQPIHRVAASLTSCLARSPIPAGRSSCCHPGRTSLESEFRDSASASRGAGALAASSACRGVRAKSGCCIVACVGSGSCFSLAEFFGTLLLVHCMLCQALNPLNQPCLDLAR